MDLFYQQVRLNKSLKNGKLNKLRLIKNIDKIFDEFDEKYKKDIKS